MKPASVLSLSPETMGGVAQESIMARVMRERKPLPPEPEPLLLTEEIKDAEIVLVKENLPDLMRKEFTFYPRSPSIVTPCVRILRQDEQGEISWTPDRLFDFDSSVLPVRKRRKLTTKRMYEFLTKHPLYHLWLADASNLDHLEEGWRKEYDLYPPSWKEDGKKRFFFGTCFEYANDMARCVRGIYFDPAASEDGGWKTLILKFSDPWDPEYLVVGHQDVGGYKLLRNLDFSKEKKKVQEESDKIST
jgi:hypothetical protein